MSANLAGVVSKTVEHLTTDDRVSHLAQQWLDLIHRQLPEQEILKNFNNEFADLKLNIERAGCENKDLEEAVTMGTEHLDGLKEKHKQLKSELETQNSKHDEILTDLNQLEQECSAISLNYKPRLQLLHKMTDVKFVYETDTEELSGYVCAEDVKPFKFNSSQQTEVEISNDIWQLINEAKQ